MGSDNPLTGPGQSPLTRPGLRKHPVRRLRIGRYNYTASPAATRGCNISAYVTAFEFMPLFTLMRALLRKCWPTTDFVGRMRIWRIDGSRRVRRLTSQA